jgi:hypothetical protein
VILSGGGREVVGAAGGHLVINLPALPDRVLRGILQALGFSWISVGRADGQLYLSRCSEGVSEEPCKRARKDWSCLVLLLPAVIRVRLGKPLDRCPQHRLLDDPLMAQGLRCADCGDSAIRGRDRLVEEHGVVVAEATV